MVKPMKPKKSVSKKLPITADLTIPPISTAKPAGKADQKLAGALDRLLQMSPQKQAAALFHSMMAPRGKKKWEF